jgi:hypothetical protein
MDNRSEYQQKPASEQMMNFGTNYDSEWIFEFEFEFLNEKAIIACPYLVYYLNLRSKISLSAMNYFEFCVVSQPLSSSAELWELWYFVWRNGKGQFSSNGSRNTYWQYEFSLRTWGYLIYSPRAISPLSMSTATAKSHSGRDGHFFQYLVTEWVIEQVEKYVTDLQILRRLSYKHGMEQKEHFACCYASVSKMPAAVPEGTWIKFHWDSNRLWSIM